MSTPSEKRRRRDEKVQLELLSGLQRILDVLHDISDGVRDLQTTSRAPSICPPEMLPAESGPILFSIAEAAELTGIKSGSLRNLCAGTHGPVTVRIGRRIFIRRTDLERWLEDSLHDPQPTSAPWRSTYTPGRMGSSLATTAPSDRSWCAGSHTEPSAASQYHGRGLCRACRDDVLINSDGRLRKHRRPSW